VNVSVKNGIRRVMHPALQYVTAGDRRIGGTIKDKENI
jgi:hypothetical protein